MLKLTYSKGWKIENSAKRDTKMRDNMRGALTQEVTRKQFLQYMGTALLMVFGVNNLVSLLTGTKPKHILVGHDQANGHHGFGSSKFGV